MGGGITKDEALQHALSQPLATVVVDMQRDYCAPGGVIDRLGYSLTGREEVAARVRDLTGGLRPLARATIYLRTVHPEWGRSAALAAQYARSGLSRSPSADVTEWFGVEPEDDDIVVNKHRYSGFASTELAALLHAKEVRTIVLSGVTTDVCVDTTARDAFLLDFNVVVASDATSASTPSRAEATLEVLDQFFGIVAPVQEIIAATPAAKGTA